MSKKLKIAVIGVGYLGNFHTEKYSRFSDVELVGVVDANIDRSRDIAEKYHTNAFSDYREILDKVDAVSIVVPTDQHYKIAKDFLDAGIDVLIEKPITHQVSEARDLVRMAKEKNRILQVGHLERFNPALQTVTQRLTEPLFIECHRLHSFVQRGTEVDVVLDLMIHDLDIILNFVKSKVTKIDAVGVAVLSKLVDIANVRLQFESGCVANVTASRVSLTSLRKIRVFQPDCYVSCDFLKSSVEIFRKVLHPGEKLPEIEPQTISLERKDILEEEIKAFIHSVRTRQKPVVSGVEALDALNLAHDIRIALKKAEKKYHVSNSVRSGIVAPHVTV